MTRVLGVVLATAAGFLVFAAWAASGLLSANLPCVNAHVPLFGGVAVDGSPCTRSSTWIPLPGWLLGATALVGLLVIGAATAARMLWRTRRLVTQCKTSVRGTSPDVALAAQHCGLEGVREVEQPVTAFCYGFIRPAVVIGSDLAHRLDADELEAVLHHEAAHARAHDAAGLLLGRTLSRLLFFLPCIGDLVRHHEVAVEVRADRQAITQTSRKALTGALLKAGAQPVVQPKDVAVGTFDPTADRLRHLALGVLPHPRTTRAHLATTILAAMMVVVGWWWVQPVAQVPDDPNVVEVPAHPIRPSNNMRR